VQSALLNALMQLIRCRPGYQGSIMVSDDLCLIVGLRTLRTHPSSVRQGDRRLDAVRLGPCPMHELTRLTT
jgi:hypothetical protein